MKKLSLVLTIVIFALMFIMCACQPATHTVNFVYNYDGAPDNGIYKTVSVNHGATVDKPTDPTRTGYTFKGWLSSANGTDYDFTTPVEDDVTVYAKWEKNDNPVPPNPPVTYAVKFLYNYTDAPNSGVYRMETVDESEKVGKPTDPERTGYTFKGWVTTADGDTAFDFNSAITEETNVYAKWEKNDNPVPPSPPTYAVTFRYNYTDAPTDGVYKMETIDEGEKVTKPSDPTRTGYAFKGWVTTADGDTAFDFDTEITEITNIYAAWEINTYTVTFNLNYDNAPNSGVYATENVNYNETATKPYSPSRTGYEFKGWLTTADGSDEYNFNALVTEATNVYAKWVAFNVSSLNTVASSDTLSVTHVNNLSNDFIMGMDASSVVSLEKSGVKFYDYNGNEADIFKTLAESGINTIRVRIWNDPYDADGNGYGGGNCDIATAIEIGKRATTYGMMLMPDFHYSDFWADPGKQQVPKAWAGYTVDEKVTAIYEFTKDCLQQLQNAGVAVNIVQVGNETTNSICGESNWANRAKLFNAGSSAVREIYEDALVAIHFTNPERAGNYAGFAKQLHDNNVDYDVFASSWYPFWHGTLENLNTVLSNVAATYNKKVMIAETSYAYTLDETDFHENTVRKGTNDTKFNGYDFSVQGQADLVRATINTIANTTNGIGVCYWEGTWITVGGSSKEENSVLWEKYGSGWASSYSAEYDPNDAGKWYGGSAVDNQALFDKNGNPLESLKVFKLVYEGNLEPEYKNLYLSGQMNDWNPEKVAEIDVKNHTVTVVVTLDSTQVGSKQGFGFTVINAEAPDASTDNQLCWIGGSTNCKIGDTPITVSFTDNSEKFVTNSNNLYATAAGTYAITINFQEDNCTPVSVTIELLSYYVHMSGGMNSWKPTKIEGAIIDTETHIARFQYTFTSANNGGFGFTVLDPQSGSGLNWIGGTGNWTSGSTHYTESYAGTDGILNVSAGSKKNNLEILAAGTYEFKIVFDEDNITPKLLKIWAEGTEEPADPTPQDPSDDIYNVYINGALTGTSWTTVKCGDIDNGTHTAAFDFTFDNAGSAFGFKIFKNDNTTTQLCWIGQDGNVWEASQITGVQFKDNTGKFSTSGSGNITVSEAGKYTITIQFENDNFTPISVTFDNAE